MIAATFMSEEAASAHTVVARQCAENLSALQAVRNSFAKNRPPVIITCARGSSDHAATYLRYILETRTGILTTSLSPSVSSLYRQWPHVPRSACVVISQSGRSHDLLAVIDGMNRRGVRTIALVNDVQSPLAQISQFVVPLLAGTEHSVAATKSFIGSMFAALQLASCLYPRLFSANEIKMLPGLLQQAWELDWEPLVSCLVNARGLYVIGRGAGLSIAGEAALKFKETCNLHAEAYSAAEVQHGPMALFNKDFPVLIFRQNDVSAKAVDELAQIAAAQGCVVFVVGGHAENTVNLPMIEAPILMEPLLQIQAFYKAANTLSLRRGYNPDSPPMLKKVTVTI